MSDHMHLQRKDRPAGQAFNIKQSKLFFVCEECHKLAGHAAPNDSLNNSLNNEPPLCAGCGKKVDYLMWHLPRAYWVTLEVALALKEHENGLGKADSTSCG